ncbi:hypothetical protein WR25_20558 [Diploscapter pachys]|uniref:Uncharacterized protein n=1 Tax=Diploscapter pachys TaxID=2018661 RepID=A0A2A2JSK5_9BILA|nr:hypothetical protein WR25_20558 [Diploscapter pachys]
MPFQTRLFSPRTGVSREAITDRDIELQRSARGETLPFKCRWLAFLHSGSAIVGHQLQSVYDIDRGDLSSILQLVYALSTYKQALRERKKRDKQAHQMAPQAGGATKIAQPASATSALHGGLSSSAGSGIPQSQTRTSRIMPPAGVAMTTSRMPQPTASSGLKPPTKCPTTGSGISSRNGSPLRKPAVSGIAVRAPSPSSAQTQTQTQAATTQQSTASSLPGKGATAVATVQKPIQGVDQAKKKTIPRASSAIRPPKSSISTSLQPAVESKMIKLNLFSKTNKGGANSKIAASQPDASTASGNAPGKEANGHVHGPVKASSASRIALPSSKTREEGGKKDEKELIQQQQQQHQARGIPTPKRKTEEKPLLAVKGVTKIAKPSGSLERKEKPKEDGTVEAEKKTTVGVVSPIVKRHAAPESSVKREDLKNSDSAKNLVGRNVNPSCSDNAPSPASPKIPTMSQLSSYQLLLSPAQTRRHPPGPSYCTMQSSTSESSLDSLSTTVKSTQDRKGASEMVRLRDRLNEYRDAIGGGLGYHNYEDSSSLSSEISDQFEPDTAPPVLKQQQQRKHPSKSGKAQSGGSGHFALSATGTEPPTQTMTVATKLADYQHLLARSPRSPSVGSDSHSSSGRTAQQNIDREGIHTLLQQCKTSQRGAAMQNFAHPSGSSSSGGFLSGDDARMNHKRRSMRGEHGSLLHTHRGLTPLCLAEPKKTSPTQFIFKTPVTIFSSLIVIFDVPFVDSAPPDYLCSFRNVLSPSDVLKTGKQIAPLLSPSPSSPRHRLPLSVAQINSHANNNGLIRTEVIYANCVDRDPMRMQQEDNYGSCGSGSLRGSQLSLAGSATMPLNERYEAELVKMNRDLENCRVRVMTLTRKQEDYAHLFDVFDHKLSVMSKHVDKSQMKADDVKKLKGEIEHLRVISNRLAVTAEKKFEGAGELLRHPSLESVTSVASQRSSMSTSSKSSKTTDKSSLNSFGKAKKSWIRSSFTKAFSKKKGKEIDEIDTNNRINEIEVDELKKKLEVRDTQLTDVRLDALDRAREVDVLRETVDKLKNENKQLRQDMHRLLSSTGTSCGRSRTSSQASMRTQLDEDVYDTPPHTSSSAASISSKRSSGCSTVRVTVNVDLKGVISKSVCPDNEIIVGYMEMPTKDTTWQEIDNITKDMFKVCKPFKLYFIG